MVEMKKLAKKSQKNLMPLLSKLMLLMQSKSNHFSTRYFIIFMADWIEIGHIIQAIVK